MAKTDPFDLEELPHLQSDRYQAYMAEAGVRSVDDLTNAVRAMERFGFARRMGESSFEFQSPIYRFLDLCMEMVHKSE
jgi:hypothetical protein